MRLVFGGPYDRIASLESAARAVGLDVQLDLRADPKEAFSALATDPSVDGGEMSVSFYMTMRSAQGENCDLVGLPVWVSRSFRHANVFVAADSELRDFSQLGGQTVGLPEYSMTMAVWLRGLWADDYDLQPKDLQWVTNRPPAALDKSSQPHPAGVAIEENRSEQSWADQLRDGRVDVWIGAGSNPTPAGVRRLLDDPFRAERTYHQRTGIFPVMHVFVLKREVLEACPELAEQCFTALQNSKRLAEARLRSTSVSYSTLPWALAAYEEQAAAFGGELWPYGVQANRPTLDALHRYMRAQELLPRELPLGDYFLPLEPASKGSE